MGDVIGRSARRADHRMGCARLGRGTTIAGMATVRLFAAARDAAGTGRDEIPGDTVDDVLTAARRRYGAEFVAVLDTCKIWVNGEPAGPTDRIGAADELAVLPPVSGG
jgi:molybdopterin synthase sulfur carrier subunit